MMEELLNLDLQRRIARLIDLICDRLLEQVANLGFKDIYVTESADVISGVQQWALANNLKANIDEKDKSVLTVGFKE